MQYKKYISLLFIVFMGSCKASLDVEGLDGLSSVSPEFNFLIKSEQKSTKSQEPYLFTLYVSQLDFTSKGTVYRFIPDISNTDGYFVFENGTGKVYQRRDWIEVKFSNFVNNELKMAFIPTETPNGTNPITANLTITCLDTQNRKSIVQNKNFTINP